MVKGINTILQMLGWCLALALIVYIYGWSYDISSKIVENKVFSPVLWLLGTGMFYLSVLLVIVGGLIDAKIRTVQDTTGTHLDFQSSTLMSLEHDGLMKVLLTVDWWLILASLFSWSQMTEPSMLSCFILSIIAWTLSVLIQINFIKVLSQRNSNRLFPKSLRRNF